MKYRVKEYYIPVGNQWDEYAPQDYVTYFAVEVRGLFLWRTVKEFRDIEKANELLIILQEEK